MNLSKLVLVLLVSLTGWLIPQVGTAQTPEAKITFRYEGTTEPKVIYRPYTSEIKPKVVKKVKYYVGTGGNKFYTGYCTYYVASQTKVTWRGNANQWAKNAKAQGREVNKVPQAGAIVQTNESRIGHVAYIESVVGDVMTISEMNYVGKGVKSTRTLSVNDSRVVAIIH